MAAPDTTSPYVTKHQWLVLASISAGVPVATVWQYYAGVVKFTAAFVSALIVLVVLNAIVLLSFRRHYRHHGKPLPRALLVGSAMLAVASCITTVCGLSLARPRVEYAYLAKSDIPLSTIEPERKRWVVELIRRTAQNSQEENKALADLQKTPFNPALYSAASFANQQVIESTMAHLKEYTDIDFQYFDKQQSARVEFSRKMAASDPAYLESWNRARQEQESIEKTANQLAHEWFAGVEALYGFAAQHTREILVKDGHIVISDPAVRQTFNDSLHQSEALHDKVVALVQEQAKRKRDAASQLASE